MRRFTLVALTLGALVATSACGSSRSKPVGFHSPTTTTRLDLTGSFDTRDRAAVVAALAELH
jgi:hypothetical protein